MGVEAPQHRSVVNAQNYYENGKADDRSKVARKVRGELFERLFGCEPLIVPEDAISDEIPGEWIRMNHANEEGNNTIQTECDDEQGHHVQAGPLHVAKEMQFFENVCHSFGTDSRHNGK